MNMNRTDLVVALGFLGASAVLVSAAFDPSPALLTWQKEQELKACAKAAAKELTSAIRTHQPAAANQSNCPAPAIEGVPPQPL